MAKYDNTRPAPGGCISAASRVLLDISRSQCSARALSMVHCCAAASSAKAGSPGNAALSSCMGGRGTQPVTSGRKLVPRNDEQQQTEDAQGDFSAAVEAKMRQGGIYANRKTAVAAVMKVNPDLHQRIWKARTQTATSDD